MMISGIEVLCDNCLKTGPQVCHIFKFMLDYDGDMIVAVRCPTCNELIEMVFVGSRHKPIKPSPDGSYDIGQPTKRKSE
jgi:hypothetical protein